MSPEGATARPMWLRELVREGAGLDVGETRADRMFREFIFQSIGNPSRLVRSLPSGKGARRGRDGMGRRTRVVEPAISTDLLG